MTELSPAQLDTLRNLSRKRDGFETGWVSIAAAQGLTELGLAVRTRSGWEITTAGRDALSEQDKPIAVQPSPFRPSTRPTAHE